MQRKYRPYVALMVAVYLVVVWSAYHWGKSQHLPDGTIFDHIENERRKKLAQSIPAEAVPQPSAESRLNTGGPVFVAVRYDASHVVFITGADTESRFGHSMGSLRKVEAPPKPAAELAGLQELWEPDSFPTSVPRIPESEQWLLEVSPTSTIPVTIERPIIAANGCSLGYGFLGSVPSDQQAAFAASSNDYFAIRHSPALSFDPPQPAGQVFDLPGWKPTADFEKQIVQLLNDRMKQEIAKVQNAGHHETAEQSADMAKVFRLDSRAHWKQLTGKLTQGDGQLTYDLRAFHLAPDGMPRIFVRARWQVAGETVFLMTAWFRAEARPVLLSADSNWSHSLRTGKFDESVWHGLNFQEVSNEFDADRDGWAELLVYTHNGFTTDITLYVYTDLGLVPLKTSYRRDLTPAASCLEQ